MPQNQLQPLLPPLYYPSKLYLNSTSDKNLLTLLNLSISTASIKVVKTPVVVASTFTPLPVSLDPARPYVFFAATNLNVGAGATVKGDLGLAADSASIGGTGLSDLTVDPSGTFGTAANVDGKIYLSDSTSTQTATKAFNSGNEQVAGSYIGAAGSLDGQFLSPGTYSWNGALALTTTVTLNGSCGDLFVFKVEGALATAASSEIILTGGLTASTVFFVVNGASTLGASSIFKGVILSTGAINLGASTNFVGQAYATTVVNIGATVVASSSDSCYNAASQVCFSASGGNNCPAGLDVSFKAVTSTPTSTR